jgi:hypothetical protein
MKAGFLTLRSIMAKEIKYVSKGFVATNLKKKMLHTFKVSIHTTGFYILHECTHFKPVQIQRKSLESVVKYLNIQKGILKTQGFEFADAGEHHVKIDKKTGMYISAL